MATRISEFRVSNDALQNAEELRRRIVTEGYIFIRRLVRPDPLLELRQHILTVLAESGWLVPGTGVLEGIADVTKKCAEGDPEYLAAYRNVQKLEAVHRFAHRSEIVDLIGQLIDETVLPHPSKVVRLWFPQNTLHTTPAHQDHVHFQGAYATYTCWMPVGDCPLELGPLAVLPGSHVSGNIFEHHFANGAGGLGIDTDTLSGDWLSTNFEIGDALIFPSLTVHQALPNLTPNRLRVSLDNRYQAQRQPIAEHQLQPHLARSSGQTWDEVYQEWASKELQYYWKDLSLQVVPSDTTRQERGFAEALELARQGNELARPLLVRIVRREPNTEQARAAAEALRVLDAQK